MEKIMIYDLIFLVVFCVGIFLFLYSHRKNLGKEGWMYMYRTKLGMKAIDKFSKKFSGFLNVLKYPIVILGFGLMTIMIFLLCQTVYTYIKYPQVSEIIKAPPVMPLIPYFTQIFNVESFMPPFYFTYFLLALLVVAIVHEFSHGIYMKLFKIKIKSTGFAFLGPILGAFVEQDDKDFQKKKNFEQMVVLGAGVFANILFALIFFGLLVLFFSLSYTPSGYIFNGYAYNVVSPSEITNYSEGVNNWTKVTAMNTSFLYLGNYTYFDEVIKSNHTEYIALYYEAPAILNGLSGAITQLDNKKITGAQDVSFYLSDKKPGEKVTIKTINSDGKTEIYEVALSTNPSNSSKGFLGISSIQTQSKGIMSKIVSKISSYKENTTYYVSNYNKDFAEYIYNLLWWVAMINLFVGLFNMLPLGILDGGRFFYLAILSISKNKKTAEKLFKYATNFIAFIFLAMILAWIYSLI
jgi:membrane-associated protease RseP (regulator of RpoE activity)